MMTKENENGVKGGFQMHSPDNRSKWEKFRKGFYDPNEHTFLGRTAKSWGQILLFYAVFYTILAILFAICMQGLLATLHDDEPKWKLEESLIGTNPGLGFRPISNRTEEGSLIWYDLQDRETSKKWVDLLNDFLSAYRVNQTGSNYVHCDFNKSPGEGQVCSVDLSRFGPCSPDNHYGYMGSKPCVFLKLNRIFGWVPNTYTAPEPNMPDDLKDKIAELDEPEREQIWITCQGQNVIDQEHVSKFEYFPNHGFQKYYFPYKNVKNYLSPLIAVQITDATPNVIISIECRAWARNINYRGGDLQREGSVSFELLIDNKDP